MKIVTAGSAYQDIDSYAGCIAYAELLQLQGTDAIAVSSAPLNESITTSLRKLGKKSSSYTPDVKDEFVLIDISVEGYFDPIVKNGQVVEIIDHHPGQEEYWQEKLGDKAQIEVVGAACTQVVERWQKAGLFNMMDSSTATLLAAGILDNTLNFTAGVTRDRDHNAYNALKTIANLPEDFAAQYFTECQSAIEADVPSALRRDTKEFKHPHLMPKCMGQIVVWDARSLLHKNKTEIENTMSTFGDDWGVNVVSISEAKSYFMAINPDTQRKFSTLFNVSFENGLSTDYTMLLRKEILKFALDKS